MKKIDYAKYLRAEIAKFSPGESAFLNETVDQYARRQSESQQAASLARYCAQYLPVNSSEFLEYCGLRS